MSYSELSDIKIEYLTTMKKGQEKLITVANLDRDRQLPTPTVQSTETEENKVYEQTQSIGHLWPQMRVSVPDFQWKLHGRSST